MQECIRICEKISNKKKNPYDVELLTHKGFRIQHRIRNGIRDRLTIQNYARKWKLGVDLSGKFAYNSYRASAMKLLIFSLLASSNAIGK